MRSYTPGLSAVQFQRQLGIKRYETAFQILHKLRAAMVRPERERIGSNGHVEVDESFVGGRTRGEGRGVTHKVLVAAAVEVRVLAKPYRKGERKSYAGRLRLARVRLHLHQVGEGTSTPKLVNMPSTLKKAVRRRPLGLMSLTAVRT